MPPQDLSAQLHAISARAFMDEPEAVLSMLDGLSFLFDLEPTIMEEARGLSAYLRERGAGDGLEAFLHEYSLHSSEGIALMGLAEALLRIPDAATADRLIHSTFESAHWETHLGHSNSFLVNASSWGLLLTGKLVQLTDASNPRAFLAKLASRIGEPVVREALKAAMRLVGGQFVLGETIEEALTRSQPYLAKGFRFSYDILGEGARSDQQAQNYIAAYRHAIGLIAPSASGVPLESAPGISVKLSALHPRYHLLKRERVMGELLPRLKEILKLAKKNNIAVSIDAEESTRLDIELQLFSEIFADPDFAGWNGIGFVVQAYQKRAFYIVDYLIELARLHKKSMPLRLVKGAYWDSEIKTAQINGLVSYPVFTCKEHTDVSYLACAAKILAARECFFPQFATHNARTLATIRAMATHYGAGNVAYEFQRLHGMGERLYEMMIADHPCRIYAPIGEHKDLLAYLIRRLLENGANTSFVNLLMDEETSLDTLLENPIVKTQNSGGRINEGLPSPRQLYGARKNSAGFDLGNLSDMEGLKVRLAAFASTQWLAAPLLSQPDVSGTSRAIPEPANAKSIVGTVIETPETAIAPAVAAAHLAFTRWSVVPIEERCRMLEMAADAIEEKRAECIALLAREAGRTVNDGINEVREAADFCRYYAAEARKLLSGESLTGPTGESNRLNLYPRGIFACISPWNFPLSIFVGQIAAALAAGNCVIAKPAEQTPLIAALAVKLLHSCGIPKDVLQLAPGDGKIGAALVSDERIAGVAFTGSMEVAQLINRSLAARKGPIVPLIAETGGINCMVVDSSALIEQAVDDIILSAFGSAGQRCSSLRILCVQEDIADALLTLLKGAMQELTLGNPLDCANDIGPVIDKEAHSMLRSHIERLQKTATLVASAPLASGIEKAGTFIAPHVFEISSIRQVEREIFGPVLHVVRFGASKMQQLVDDINSSGFGLTFGIQSRIEEHIRFFANRVRAGNLYVNRSMIGAVVGVQPFGGEGLSGTGPKAGGPHYLPRFMSERTLSINTAAIGGNIALLSTKS